MRGDCPWRQAILASTPTSRKIFMSTRSVRRTLTGALAIVAFTTGAAAAQAQSVITGRVTDAQGNGVPAASVALPTLGVGIGASTNAEGNFTINLGANVYAGQSLVVHGRRIGLATHIRYGNIKGV